MLDNLISIIIPTYNRSEILASTSVLSVLNQIYKNWELIIVDDGSTDDTKGVCERLLAQDSRIRYYYKENGGQGSARNLGIRMAKGDFVILLDSDDALLPEMIDILFPALIKGNGDMINCQKWDFDYHRGIYNVGGDNPSCIIYRKNLFETLGFYNESRELIGIEDTDLDMSWAIYSAKQNFTIKKIKLDSPMVIYLNHRNQATSDYNLLKKKLMMQSLADKYSDKSEINLSHIFGQLGNLKILLNDLSGREDIKKSLNLRFNFVSVIYLCLSYLGIGIYKLSLPILKLIRDSLFGKIKVLKMKMRYPKYYLEATKICATYKDWE